MKKVIVTAALPYANGKLHLGHLRSTYIPADAFVRYLRMKGYDAIYICGTDEHGTPISVRAEQEGKSPKEVADYYHELIKEDLVRMGCSFDNFSRTTKPLHYEITRKFFEKLLERGYVEKKEVEQLYCPKCERFLPDRYVEGTCPYCGNPSARGDICEACGRYLVATELKDPRCILCGTTPILKKSEHFFFKLSALEGFLKKWIQENPKLPANVKNYVLNWLRGGLRDWCITRDMKWGVPVPGYENKVFYVWFDAPIGYISSTVEWAEKKGDEKAWEDYWKGGGEIYHFLGKDNIYQHAIFWTGMLKAHGEFGLPTAIVAGEFLTLEGKKMSKSRGWLVEIGDYLSRHDPDPLRYYLLASSPLSKDADFSWKEYARRNNDELADILGNFVHRTLTFIYKRYGGKVPEPKELDERDEEILDKMKEIVQRFCEDMESFEFHSAAKRLIELAALGNKYLNEKEPWKKTVEEGRTTFYICAQLVKALALLMAPIMPFSAEKLWKMLGMEGSVHDQRWSDISRPVPPGTSIGKPEPLFRKISESEVEEERRKLEERSRRALYVTAQEFARMDIRVGEIVDATRIDERRVLLKISIGRTVKQTVAGIGEWYDAKELVGRQVVVLTNIEPRRIKGYESNCMILAAEDGEGLSLLVPDRKVERGAKVK